MLIYLQLDAKKSAMRLRMFRNPQWLENVTFIDITQVLMVYTALYPYPVNPFLQLTSLRKLLDIVIYFVRVKL